MRKSPLPARELTICKRLKQARERLGFTQERCAREVGIQRGTLANFEYGKTPVRYDVALRFCRSLIISEEWLAGGKTASAQRAARQHGIVQPEASPDLLEFFFRQCVDLAAEPEYHDVAPGTLFSEAFDQIFAPVYERLVMQFFHLPRIVLRDSDSRDLIEEYLAVVIDRWMRLLENEAGRLGANEGVVRRSFLRSLFETGDIMFRRYLGQPTPEIKDDRFNFLRIIANHPSLPIGPLRSEMEYEQPRDFAGRQNPNVIEQLTTQIMAAKLASMNLREESLWPKLREDIRRLVGRRGMKSALARDIGVSRQAVNALLRRNRPYVPSGESALRLFKWVETARGAQQNQSAGSAVTRPALKTRERKSKHEKPNSDRRKK